MAEDSDLVSLADVARLAGVTRPAASNWRRRSADFPKPVRDTGAASLFDRAEITAWLARHGKQLARPTVREEIAAALNTARHGTTTDAMARTWLAELADGVEPPSLSRLVHEHGAPDVCEALIAEVVSREHRGPWLDVPPDMVDLVLALAEPHLHGTVYDPDHGLGTFLLAAHRASSQKILNLVGETRDEESHVLAAARLAIHGVPANLRKTTGQGFQDADVVLTACTTGHYLRMVSGLGRSASSLRPGGRGFHLTSNTISVGLGTQIRLRSNLVRSGLLRAVVELPAVPFHPRGQQAVLWLLADESEDIDEVLLIDASDAQLGAESIQSIVAAYRGWEDTGAPVGGGFSTAVVRRERLLAGGCQLTVEAWQNESNVDGALQELDGAKARMAAAAKRIAEPVVLPEFVDLSTQVRSVRDLLESGDAEFVRGVAWPRSDQLGSKTAIYSHSSCHDNWVAKPVIDVTAQHVRQAVAEVQHGDVLIATSAGELHAAVVSEERGIMEGQDVRCLRLRNPSMARARTIAAMLSRKLRKGVTIHDLRVRWPSDEECERIDDTLDLIEKLQRDAAEMLAAAGTIHSSALKALHGGAVPADSGAWELS